MKNWSNTTKIIVALVVIAVIAAIYNWDKISGLWSSDRTSTGAGERVIGATGSLPYNSSERTTLVNQALSKYANHRSFDKIKSKLSSMTAQQLKDVVSQKVVWCVCENTDYGFTTNCSLACA